MSQTAPVANWDGATSTQMVEVSIDVLNNDTDNESNIDPGSVDTTGLRQPSHGSITGIDPLTGFISYTPDLGHFGADTFEYHVCDLTALCDVTYVVVYTSCAGVDWRDAVGGKVFIDLDNDGIQDPGESGDGGLKIIVYRDNNRNGILDAADTRVDSTITGGDGSYNLLLRRAPWAGFGSPVPFGQYDAHEDLSNGNMDMTSSNIYLSENSGTSYLAGLMYRNMNIPKNGLIVKAELRFTSNGNYNPPSSLTFHSQYVGNAPAITTSNGNLSSRTKTKYKVQWNNIGNWKTDTLYRSPSLTPIIQEVINHPGWNNYNYNLILAEGFGERTNFSREVGGNSKSAYFWVHYSADSSYKYFIRIDTASLPGPVVYSTDTSFHHETICGGQNSNFSDFGIRYMSEIDCGNGIDDDGDGDVDCADSDCSPPPPGIITPGNAVVCANATGETYSIVSVGPYTYNWTVPSGAVITGGQGSTSITVDWGTTSGSVCVEVDNGSCSSPSSCLPVNLTFIPDAPTGIGH